MISLLNHLLEDICLPQVPASSVGSSNSSVSKETKELSTTGASVVGSGADDDVGVAVVASGVVN